jgi:hypothetical protein
MSSIVEIEKLSAQQLDELVGCLELLRMKRTVLPPVENWLKHARGAALAGQTTEHVMALTRGEE